jgi:hypothetical protein
MSTKNKLIFPSTLDRWKIQNLDFNWYFAFTIMGGFFGLDYMYIGSPIMGVLKFITNLFTFGYWWFYDIINAAVAQDQIRLYGPSAPVFGPTGIGGGRFKDPKFPTGPKEKLDKHMNFLIYGLMVVIGGIMGVDHFFTGDMFGGTMNLLATVSVIGAPISFLWQVFKMYRYYLNTDECINVNWEYFGAPRPSGIVDCPSIPMILTVWLLKTMLAVLQLIPFFGPIVSLLQALIKNLEVAYGFVVEAVKAADEIPSDVMDLLDMKANMPIPCSVDEAIPKVESLPSAPPPQAGGGSSESVDLLVPVFALTIVFVIVSSVFLSLRRSTQNGPKPTVAKAAQQFGGKEATDEPPQPRDPGDPSPI